MRELLLFTMLAVLSFSGAAQRKRIERSCPDEFEMHKNGEKEALRYASNFSLNKKDTSVTSLLIYIHGVHRNAMGYFEYADEAVRSAGQKKTTLIIAPQYATEQDLEDNKLGRAFLYWENATWKDGAPSVSNGYRPLKVIMSSYEVMDSLIAAVLGSGKFPNISKVIVAGHSAGGQFVQRYSAITPLPDMMASTRFRFIVMNPSSYMYPDDKRPLGNGTFVIPDTAGCARYNCYPKGLTKLFAYAQTAGADRIFHNMLQRDIVILLGGNDTEMDDPDLDVSCEAVLQGKFRLERGLYFIDYITSFPEYGNKKNFGIVPGVDHNGDRIINSAEAKKWIFGW